MYLTPRGVLRVRGRWYTGGDSSWVEKEGVMDSAKTGHAETSCVLKYFKSEGRVRSTFISP
jgi:hypothetical protein